MNKLITPPSFINKIVSGCYQLLWCVAPLLIRLYLKRRAKKSPAYLKHWDERFGGQYPNAIKSCIWVHAVSVGETRAAEPLIYELQKCFPNIPVLITQMTPTGRQTAATLFAHAQIRYLPYDKKNYVATFLHAHQPLFGVLMETEIWPNLMIACQQQQIPLFLANARLSEKSLRGYLKIKHLIVPAMRTLTLVCAQTRKDANRLKRMGAPHIEVCGNTKYDIEIPAEAKILADTFKERIGQKRQVVVCASTRKTEEALLLTAWQNRQTDALLVIVPRHPERFDEIFALAEAMGFQTQRRSDHKPVAADTQVWLGDSMGELLAYYLCADVAFVGGTLAPVGGQNILEPLQCGKPTLFGLSTFNFQQICHEALKAQAAIQIESAKQWQEVTEQLLADAQAQTTLVLNAQTFTRSFRGASRKIAQSIRAEGTQTAGK